jgi:lipopolysaccharide export system protein LptC
MRAQLRADTAYVFNEGTRIELRNVNTEFFSSTGAKNATLTSREGTYNTQIGQMEARRAVVVVSVDGRRLTTEQLRFSEQANLITSDSAFTATQGARVLKGVGFESDPQMNNVRCKAACRGEAGAVNTPQPAPSQGAATIPQAGSRPNTFVLPGQQTPPPTPSPNSPEASPAPPSQAPAPAPAPTVPDTGAAPPGGVR